MHISKVKKGYLKRIFGVFLFLNWLILVSRTFMILFNNSISIKVKIGFLVGCVLYTVISLVVLLKDADNDEKNKKAEILSYIKERYKYYIELVDDQVQETLKKYSKDEIESFDIDTSLEYLVFFDYCKKYICGRRNIKELDSFILASCLVYGIIYNPIIISKENQKVTKAKDSKFYINVDIAMHCAFKIISEPTIYYYDADFSLTPKKHPKVDIVVPKGLIDDNDFCKRIVDTIYSDLKNDKISIMQFSNLLYLLYLNCK